MRVGSTFNWFIVNFFFFLFPIFRDVSPVELSVHDPDVGYLNIKMAGKSIRTVLWRSKWEPWNRCCSLVIPWRSVQFPACVHAPVCERMYLLCASELPKCLSKVSPRKGAPRTVVGLVCKSRQKDKRKMNTIQCNTINLYYLYWEICLQWDQNNLQTHLHIGLIIRHTCILT